MNIYKLTRTDSIGWDEFDSAVIVADNQMDAIELSMRDRAKGGLSKDNAYSTNTWTNNIEYIMCEYVGTTNIYNEPKIILASFNAG